MKNLLKVVGLLCIMMLAACSKVPAGNVGVKFNLYGGDKGVQTQELPPGRYWLTWNQELYTFPTFTQTYTWQQKGDDGDESLSFQTVEGLSVNADVGITYHIDPTKVTKLFQTYRKGIDEITHVYLRNMVRDALVTEASTMGIESVYGKGKADLISKVQGEVQHEMGSKGIVIEKVYWIGDLRLPQNVVNSINAKIQATQMAQQRENEVAQAQAEAQKEVAVADGQAQAKLKLATAEAQAIAMRGKAMHDNPGVVELNWIEKWDGHLPQTQLGSGTNMMYQIPEQK